jgi:hypothetical protein
MNWRRRWKRAKHGTRTAPIENETMNSKDIFKDSFSLAVRLLGLYLFYVGLKDLDTPALLDVTIIKAEKLSDIVSAVLPVIFNLAVAWWLLGSRVLTKRAYPKPSQSLDHLHSPSGQAVPVSKSHQTQRLTDMEAAEEKLAALVGKPKDGSLAQHIHGEDTKRVVIPASA